jgi:hypothetical protein
VGERLLELGYRPGDTATVECIERWRDASLHVIREGRSADYLRRSQQEHDLEFVLSHIDDVATVPWLATGEFIDAGQQVAVAAALPTGRWSTKAIQ